MQIIPPAIKTLLKSRSMTGPNAPTAVASFPQVVLGQVDWLSATDAHAPTQDVGIGSRNNQPYLSTTISFAKKANGKLIMVGVYTATDTDLDQPVYEGEIASVAALTSADNTVTGWQATGITLDRYARATVFNVGTGLYITTVEAGTPAVLPGRTLIWRSPGGNGGDWLLHGTVMTIVIDSANAGILKPAVAGIPFVTSTGRWVVLAARYSYTGYARQAYACIYTSDDAGVTWTQRTTLGTHIGLADYAYAWGWSRTIVQDSTGRLWTSIDVYSSYTNVHGFYVFYSGDNGVTWTKLGGRFYPAIQANLARFAPGVVLHPDGIGLYVWTVPGSGDDSDLYLCAAPIAWTTNDDYVHVTTWPHTIGGVPLSWQTKPLIMTGLSPSQTVVCVGQLVFGFPVAPAEFGISAVTIDREQAASAQRATVSWPNVNPFDLTDVGYYSPDRGDDIPGDKNEWYHGTFPGRTVQISLGYGANLIRAFTGQIDDTTLNAEGGDYRITLECRDAAWAIIDKMIMDGASYKLTYLAVTLEAIVSDLLVRAGIAIDDITVELTGITITEKTFERLTYADGLAWAQTVSGFELICDESGKWSFHYPTDRQPLASDEALVLTGTAWTNLANPYVVSASDVVRSAVAGGGTLYSRVTDYEIEYGLPARIRRRAGSTIGDGATVYATYVFAAWSFEQGVDLFRLPYTISRRDLFGTIVVYGQDAAEAVISGTYTYAGSTAYGVPADKVLFVDMRELDTVPKCQAAADQLGHDMVTKLRQVQFAVVGNPWIQVGDCVRVRESSSTISEIYRITSLAHSLDESGFVTQFVGYHYGYTPL